MKKYYNYVYKITNKLNNKFYIGVHRTSNLNDGYMGSGNAIQRSIKKYGIENFLKEILYFFDTIEEAYECESKIVTEELVKNRKCYNLKPGGYGWKTEGIVTVKDNNGNNCIVYKTDARYINGELVPIWVGKKHTDETKKYYQKNYLKRL